MRRPVAFDLMAASMRRRPAKPSTAVTDTGLPTDNPYLLCLKVQTHPHYVSACIKVRSADLYVILHHTVGSYAWAVIARSIRPSSSRSLFSGIR